MRSPHGRRRRLAAVMAALLLLPFPAAPAVASPESGSEPPAPEAPHLQVEAPSAILMDALTGQVLYEKDARARRYPASLTKIMTMYLVLQAVHSGRVGWDDPVTASDRAAGMGGTQIFLQAGEVMSVRDLFKSVAVASANDAAVALAEHVAGSVEAFVALMNETARELGLQDTHFANPHGLHDPEQVTTAHDMAVLARALLREYPEVLQYTATWIDYVREGDRRFQLVNTNKMVAWYKGVDGLKTGWHSQAGWNVVATQQQGDTRLIAVIMGHENSRERFAEAHALLRYGFSRWESVQVTRGGDVVTRVRVYEGAVPELELVAPATWGVLVPKGQREGLTREVVAPRRVVAPVRQGDVLGQLIIRRGQEELGRLDLAAARDVPRLGLAAMLLRVVGGFWPLGR